MGVYYLKIRTLPSLLTLDAIFAIMYEEAKNLSTEEAE